jgi:hypothetical protein
MPLARHNRALARFVPDLQRISKARLQRAERIVRGWRPTFGTVHAEGDLLDVSTRALEGNGEAEQQFDGMKLRLCNVGHSMTCHSGRDSSPEESAFFHPIRKSRSL